MTDTLFAILTGWGVMAVIAFCGVLERATTFGEAAAFGLFWPLWLIKSIARGSAKVWRTW